MTIIDYLKENLLKVIIAIIVIALLYLVYYASAEPEEKQSTSFSSEKKIETSFKTKELTFEDMMKKEPKPFFGTKKIKKQEEYKKNNFDFGNKKIYENKDSIAFAKLQNKLKEMEYLNKSTSQKKKVKTKPTIKVVPKKKLTFEEKLILSRQGQNTNNTVNNTILNPIEFSAVINGNQTAYDNAMITVRVLNNVTYNNTVLKRNTYLYGVAKIIKTGRIKIHFTSMTKNRKRKAINLIAYDELDGYEGLIIKDEEVLTQLNEETNSEINSEVSTKGTVGRILSSVLRKKKKEKKIQLYDEQPIILKGHL